MATIPCNKIVPFFGLAALAAVATPALAQDGAADAQAHQPWATIETFCTECHNFQDWAGGVAFDTMSADTVPQDAEVWEEALSKLHGRLMPPPGNPQPEQAEIDALANWLETTIDGAESGRPAAGHVPIQRLNAIEYVNTVRDLIGVELDPASILPTEVEVDGFDNIAEALNVSPAFLEQYVSAGRRAARLAVGDSEAAVGFAFYPASRGGGSRHLDGMPLGTRGGMSFEHDFPADGEYRFSVRDLGIGLYPRTTQGRHTLVIFVDGEEVFRHALGGDEDQAIADRDGAPGAAALMAPFTDIPVQVSAGRHEVAVTFIRRASAASEYPNGGRADRMSVPDVGGGIDVKGPYNVTGVSMTPSRRLVFTCYPETVAEEAPCAEEIVTALAGRAFRREVTQADLDLLMPFYERARAEGASFDKGVEDALAAVLASPHFLFRTITPPAEEADPVFALNDLELASRLSFFLWSQGPDEALMTAAHNGDLSDADGLARQVERMLADPRAETLVTNFAMKWLGIDDLEAVVPDSNLYGGFSDSLREDFETEVERFIASILLEDRSVLDLLDADHTFVNEALARHYGIDGVRGDQFRRVALADTARHGILGKGAVLLRTSYGDRTSPVLRGAWVLDKLLGTPPAPPPPDVETDLTVQEGEPVTTVRARLEQHRADQSCNSCHGVIDPWGLALENFDVIGRWRDRDDAADEAVDATTVLASGETISGPDALREALVARGDLIAQNFTEKLMMYALGREIEHFDMPQVRAIARDAAEQDYRLSSIVLGIVTSDAFRMQGETDVAELADEQATSQQ